MAKTIDEQLKKQLEKPQTWFCKYFPQRIKNVGLDAVVARELVWAFKDSRNGAQEEVAQKVAQYLMEKYGEQLKNMVFVCVPASSQAKHESRYKGFCERVSELSGITNGYSLVGVSGERLSIHEHRKSEKEIRKVSIINFDETNIQGKTICVFDDVITTGRSYAVFADQLEQYAANVIEGIFLARTHYRYQ